MRTTEPTEIIKGERIEWTRTLDDYPATLWTLKYRFRNTGTGANVTCTADGTNHLAVMPGTTSDDFTVLGKAKWQAWVEEIGNVTNTFIVDQGEVLIKQGFPDATTAIEIRTPAKIMLDAIDAALSAFATSDVTEYEIETPAGRRRVKRSDKATLTSQRKYWATVVRRENALEKMKNGEKWGTTVTVRMP